MIFEMNRQPLNFCKGLLLASMILLTACSDKEADVVEQAEVSAAVEQPVQNYRPPAPHPPGFYPPGVYPPGYPQAPAPAYAPEQRYKPTAPTENTARSMQSNPWSSRQPQMVPGPPPTWSYRPDPSVPATPLSHPPGMQGNYRPLKDRSVAQGQMHPPVPRYAPPPYPPNSYGYNRPGGGPGYGYNSGWPGGYGGGFPGGFGPPVGW
jgi:hypothetical protein